MFNLGLPEFLLLAVVVLLLFGPKRLPEVAKGLGKSIRDFKKAVNGESEKDELESGKSTLTSSTTDQSKDSDRKKVS